MREGKERKEAIPDAFSRKSEKTNIAQNKIKLQKMPSDLKGKFKNLIHWTKSIFTKNSNFSQDAGTVRHEFNI